MNNKKDYQIVWQSTMKCACDLIPEKMKGTEEGYELFKRYHREIFKSYCNWEDSMTKVKDSGNNARTINEL